MSRRTLTDEQWARIEPLVPGRASSPGRTAADTRLFIDAVLWFARGATPWRDLPPELGKWTTTHRQFRRWSLSGVWERLFNALAEEPDFEYVLVDATISKAHADAAGAKGAAAHGIGRSRCGLTTKIHAAVDALGAPLRVAITPGQWGDCPQARGLIAGVTGVEHVIADAAYDADHLRAFIRDDLGASAQIPSNPSRTFKHPLDKHLYKERWLVECFFNKIKRFRRIALRCEKTIASFTSPALWYGSLN